MKKRILKIAIFVFLIVFLFYWFNTIFIAKHRYWDGYDENFYQNYTGFQNLPKESLDIIFLGSSNVFLNVSPPDLYDKYGFTSYNLATPMQMLEQSYYQLKEALKTQNPKVVLLECLVFEAYDFNGESYTHMAYDAYPMNLNKFKHLKEVLYDTYDFNSFLIPFWLYHSRYDELDLSDLSGVKYDETEDFLGYAPAFSINGSPVYGLMTGRDDTTISGDKMAWFEKIYTLCKEKDIRLILFKTPCQTSWFLEDSEKMDELSLDYGLEFWEIGGLNTINPDTDFCDGGGHLNDYGAVKVTTEIGRRLKGILGESLLKEKNVRQYYAARMQTLDKCRSIQKIKFENDLEEYKKKLQKEDYTIAVAGTVDSFCMNDLKKYIGNSKWKANEKFSFIYNIKKNEMYSNFGEMSSNITALDVYCRNSEIEGGLMQYEYNNYLRWDFWDRNIYMMVIDNEYKKVIDLVSIYEENGIVKLCHVR